MFANAAATSSGALAGKALYIEDNPINILVMTHWAERHRLLRFEVSESGLDGVQRFSNCSRTSFSSTCSLRTVTGLRRLDVCTLCLLAHGCLNDSLGVLRRCGQA